MISLASGGGLVAQTLNPGGGIEGSAGGVFGPPNQAYGQPRSIMTAGAGTRAQNRGSVGNSKSGIVGAKRL